MGFNGVTPIRHGSADQVELKEVLYTGSDALQRGYLVCYDRDNSTATNAAGTALAATAESFARVFYVEKPAAGNVQWFAGVVAQAYPAQTGGQHILIEVPTGKVTQVYTSASCTINTTLLSVTPGSYAAGAGTGPVIGMALQTVDRSSTNGVVQAKLDGVRGFGTDYGTDAGTSPSQTIWSNFPSFADIIANPSLGIAFDSRLGSAVVPYSDTNALIQTGTDGETTLFTTASNDECGLLGATGGFNIATSGTKVAFEARVKVSSILLANGTAFGFSGAPLGKADVLLDAGAIPSTSFGFVGFSIPDADPDGIDVAYQDVGSSLNIHDANAVVPVANTYVKLGLYFNGTDCTTYLNGVTIGDPILAADIAATDFPGTLGLRPCVWAKGGDSGDFTCTVDWFRAIQLR